jgi:hypothetical protein
MTEDFDLAVLGGRLVDGTDAQAIGPGVFQVARNPTPAPEARLDLRCHR